MANEKSLARQLGATPQKLAVIGVLAVVLVGVLYMQFGGSLGRATVDQDVSARAPRGPGQGASARHGEAEDMTTESGAKQEWLLASVERRPWKAPALGDVVRYDPFALPAAFPQPAATGVVGIGMAEAGVESADANSEELRRAEAIAAVQAKLQELQQRGVRVIIQGRRQAAVIGDRTVHVGDDVDGFTVKAIKSDGVVVERTLE